MSVDQPQEQLLLVPIFSRTETTVNDAEATAAHGVPPLIIPNYGTLRLEAISQPESSLHPESSLQVEDTANDAGVTAPHGAQLPVTQSYGIPMQKPFLHVLDSGAVVLSIVALILALMTVSTSLQFAAKLQYTNQIIIIGFLLGLMSHCSQRVLPYLFILLEARFGSSTLQNYDGILRWAPTASQLSFIWRLLISTLLLLPLGLGILYKRFTGGMGILPSYTNSGFYAPTGPPGLQNVGALSIMANATVPFLAASSNDMQLPNFSNGAKAYGFNILLLSNISAAALDGPLSNQVSDIQLELNPDDVSILTADVRATVVHYNSTAETHRNDTSFWEKYWPPDGDDGHLDVLQMLPMLWEYYFAVRAKNTPGSGDAWQWDHSWIFVALYSIYLPSNPSTFQQKALGFDINRHSCQGTWRITRSSIELLSGKCSKQPLAYEFQYLQNSFMTAAYDSLFLQSQYLGRFAKETSHWTIPTHVVTIASMFESYIAAADGYVHLQPNGPLWNIWNPSADPDFQYNETYFVANASLYQEVPTLKANAWLYVILFIQPILTIIAFLATMFLHGTPVSRGFGLLSVLAGVERDGLDILAGATFSGELEKPIRLTIDASGKDVSSPRVFYVVGGNGKNGRISRRKKYR